VDHGSQKTLLDFGGHPDYCMLWLCCYIMLWLRWVTMRWG